MPYQYRKSPRADWFEYNEGIYFITICTTDKRHYFGHITDGKMYLSPIGKYLLDELQNPSTHHPHIRIESFVVMPNHLHAIVIVAPNTGDTVDLTPANRMQKSLAQKQRPVLSRYIGSLKSAVTKYAHSIGCEFTWQERFHDHIIRGLDDWQRITEYIEHNIENWGKDCFNE